MRKSKLFSCLVILLAAIMVIGLAACGETEETTAPTDDTTGETTTSAAGEMIGTGAVKFDTGKDISGEVYAVFYADGERFIDQFYKDYESYRPNVDLTLVYTAWSDYWTKLPVEISSAGGPDLYYFHNMYHTLMVEEGLQDPYPEELVSGLREDFDNIDQFTYDGKVFYVPTGNGHGMVYYNKTLWTEAGLTEDDIPETWEETHALAKKLTQKEGNQLVVSGFNLLPVGAFAEDWVYLSGKFQYSEDGNQTLLNQPEVQKTYEFFLDWVLEDGIASTTFPEAQQSFMDGTAAMVWNHPYFAGVLNANAPDIDFGVFPLPRFEDKPRNWHYNNPDVSMGINANASDEGKEIAIDMLHLFFAEDKYLEEWCLGQGLAPTKKTLFGNQRLEEHPIITVQMADSENTIYPGGSVDGYSTIRTNALIDPMIHDGEAWEDVIDQAVEEMNALLERSDFIPVERSSHLAGELD